MTFSETLEKAEVSVTRDPDTVAADISIIIRHLRRKLKVAWGLEPTADGAYEGVVLAGGIEWHCDLSYREKYDAYRFRLIKSAEHSNQMARRLDFAAVNPYALCNDVISGVATLRLIHTLDLDKD